MTKRESLQRTREVLHRAQIADAETDAWLLYAHVTGESRNRFFLEAEEELPEAQAEELRKLARRRASHIPVQHLVGEAWIDGRAFWVSGDVLIPRFDTEILLQAALQKISELKAKGVERPRVLDLCTGSGCIALTLLLECPDISLSASDVSAEALEVSRENARRLTGSEESVRWIQSDLFEQIDGVYDLIVTNPPYIKNADLPGLDPEVRDHEPHTALLGGEDGLCFIKRIAREAKTHLSPKGRILMEIGDEEGEDVLRLFEEEAYEDLRILRDLAGRDRVVTARRGRNG